MEKSLSSQNGKTELMKKQVRVKYFDLRDLSMSFRILTQIKNVNVYK